MLLRVGLKPVFIALYFTLKVQQERKKAFGAYGNNMRIICLLVLGVDQNFAVDNGFVKPTDHWLKIDL